MASSKEADAKSKFGLLMHYLVALGFSFELIEQHVIHGPYFQFFEHNDLDAFLDKPIEDIVEQIFHKQVYIDYSKPIASEIYWAGEMYVSLLLNLRIPLQRSFLVLGLGKMISLFHPYHEMNDMKLHEHYLQEEKSCSVLQLLMDRKHSMQQLSFLIGINRNTLLSYLDNQKLFAMSLENARKLADYFDVPFSVFQRISSFHPNVELLMQDPLFQDIYLKHVQSLFHLGNKHILLAKESFDKAYMKSIIDQGVIIFDARRFVLLRKRGNGTSYIPITQSDQYCLADKSIADFTEKNPFSLPLF